jgi:hypothetical protein
MMDTPQHHAISRSLLRLFIHFSGLTHQLCNDLGPPGRPTSGIVNFPEKDSILLVILLPQHTAAVTVLNFQYS